MQRGELRVVVGGAVGGGERLGGHVGEGAVQVVDGLEQVLGELLDGEVAGGLLVAGRAVLEGAELGDCADVLVLLRVVSSLCFYSDDGGTERRVMITGKGKGREGE